MGMHKGQTNSGSFKKGQSLSSEVRKKISKTMKGTRKNEKNPIWKGDNVGVPALHEWVRRNKPKPKFCEICNIDLPYDLSNISGKYKRDIDDYVWSCRSCHMKSDGRISQLKQFQEKR